MLSVDAMADKPAAARVAIQKKAWCGDNGSIDHYRIAPPMYDRVLNPPTAQPAWLARLKERWREGIRHKVTPLGAMMLVLLFTSGILAFTTTQNVFFLLFSLLLASILLSSFVNRLMLAGLEVRLELPAHAMAKEPAACRLVIANRKSWLASFALELVAPVGRRFYVPIVQPGGSATVAVEVVWSKRGIPDPVIVELSTRFPFGFSVRRTRVAVRIHQAIYPSIREQAGFADVLDQLRQKAAVLSAAAEAEFSHLREYRSGDDWRRIAWGKSLKGGNWIVKETSSAGAGFLNLGLSPAARDLERTIQLAAYIVWELQHRAIPFQFDCGAETLVVNDSKSCYRVLAVLAGIEARALSGDLSPASTFLLSDAMVPEQKNG